MRFLILLFILLPVLVLLVWMVLPRPKKKRKIAPRGITPPPPAAKPLESAMTDYVPYQLLKHADLISAMLSNINSGLNNSFFQSLIRDVPAYNPMVKDPGIYFDIVNDKSQIVVLSGDAVVKIQQNTSLQWELRDPSQLAMLKDIEYLWNNRNIVTSALKEFATRILHKEEIVNFTHLGMKRFIHIKIDYGIPYLYLDRSDNKSVISFCVFINYDLYSAITDVEGTIIKKEGIDIDPYHFYTDVINATQVHSVHKLNFVME